ncbi:MAG: hypothetical protein J6R04_05645, partial [Clostridia bacterium]|nr:hypothetical protein [Clostridia bacterium]
DEVSALAKNFEPCLVGKANGARQSRAGSKSVALGTLSWFVLWRAPKNERQQQAANAPKAV